MMRRDTAATCRDTATIIIGLTVFLAAPAIALDVIEEMGEVAVQMMPVQLSNTHNFIP